MSFQDKVKQHLSEYKKAKYPHLPNGIWRPKTDNKVLGYAFSQNGDDYKYNILENYREPFFKSALSKIKRHIYFHHLNSSQAMCINFFYPLVVESQLHVVLNYLGFTNEQVDYGSTCFEKDSTIDSKGGRRATNFDFYIKTESGKEFFFEIKYTENEFGIAKNDEDHRLKYEAVYKQNMQAINNEFSEMQVFFKHYQIIRNLIHIGEDKYVVFLYPKGNVKIKQGAEKAKKEILRPEWQPNFFDVRWEELVAFVKPKVKGKNLSESMEEFQEKYLK